MEDAQRASLRAWVNSIQADVMAGATSKPKRDLGTWAKTVVHRQTPDGEFEIVPEKCVDWHRVV